MNSIEAKIRELICEAMDDVELDMDSIGVEDELINYGVSSIVFIKMVIQIEEEFEIELDDDDLDNVKFSTIKDYVDFVKMKTKEAGV